MNAYTGFIPCNTAPVEASSIGVYDNNGTKVGSIDIPDSFKALELGSKLYSFGALSDVHIHLEGESSNSSRTDFAAALNCLKEQGAAFTCVCGDLTKGGSAAQLKEYAAYIEANCPDMTVYSITGNHDTWLGEDANIEEHIGQPLYYSFTRGDDVFIMLGLSNGGKGNLFTKASLQWLYETLEDNRNKRCFLFEHVFPKSGCGNANGMYDLDIWGDNAAVNPDGIREVTIFESLLRHYRNVIFFHGHSHINLADQLYDKRANYDKDLGCHSIHIPSVSVLRDADGDGISESNSQSGSQGYVVDVYENAVILKGRDFEKELFLPIACYRLETPLYNIPENGYVDITDALDTDGTNDIIRVEGVALSSAAQSMRVGESFTLNAAVIPSDAHIKTVYWSSSAPDVATVENGVVTANAAGDAVISVTTADGGFCAECVISVSAVVAEPVNLADPDDAMWKADKRINSSKLEVDVDTAHKCVLTNLIDVSDTSAVYMYVKGLDITSSKNGINYGRIYYYSADKSYYSYQQPSVSAMADIVTVENGVTKIDIQAAKAERNNPYIPYFRLGGFLTGTASDVFITIDQPIEQGG